MYVCERFLEQIQHILCTPVTMFWRFGRMEEWLAPGDGGGALPL